MYRPTSRVRTLHRTCVSEAATVKDGSQQVNSGDDSRWCCLQVATPTGKSTAHRWDMVHQPQLVEKVANRNVMDFGYRSRRRFATPADSPRHDCTPYSHVHVHREILG